MEMLDTLTLDWLDSENVDDIWNVVKHVYGDRIREHYEGWCEDKESINETKHEYLRRLPEFDKLIKSSLEMFDRWHFSYIDVDYIIKHLSEDVAELYYFRTQEDIYIGGDEYDELIDFLKVYLEKNWKDRIDSLINSAKTKDSINENKSPRIRRVLHIIQGFMEHLDPTDICEYWDRNEGDRYINEVMGELVYYLDYEYFKGIDNDKLYDELVDYGVRQDITEFFYDTIDSCTE
jgi:hypothetical protein